MDSPQQIVEQDGLLLVLHNREEAQDLANELRADGWAPATVQREMLAGEDDAEDVDWVIVLYTAPDGLPATSWQDHLENLAETHDGFISALG